MAILFSKYIKNVSIGSFCSYLIVCVSHFYHFFLCGCPATTLSPFSCGYPATTVYHTPHGYPATTLNPTVIVFLWLSSHHIQPYCVCFFMAIQPPHSHLLCLFLWLSSHHTQPYPAAYMTDDWFIGIFHYYTPNPVSSAPSQGAMPPGVA